MWYRSCIFFLGIIMSSCGGDTLPKPKAVLRLSYPQPQYAESHTSGHCPFTFEMNTIARLSERPHSCDLNIEYPTMKATLYLSYKKVHGDIRTLLRDAQKFTFEHTVKADNIASTPFVNDSTKVYGMLYQVYGNAASQAQFYATDSTQHFISGSVYFKAVPNYDSIQPASHYLENDVKKLMETLRWK